MRPPPPPIGQRLTRRRTVSATGLRTTLRYPPTMVPSRRLDVGRILDAAEAASPVEAIEQVARALGLAFDAVSVSFLIADLSGRALVRLAHVPLRTEGTAFRSSIVDGERREDQESATVLPFDGGPAEQAIRTQTVQVLPPGSGLPTAPLAGLWSVLAPVTERGESIGLLELYLPAEPDPEVLAEVGHVAHLLAFVVIANRRHTDLFEWGQRTRAFSLSAEIQQRLLPQSRTCEAAAFTLAGWLEPAESIGGDTFDYSLARDLLHLSLTDAMGHGVNAALTASMCLGGLRGARRRGVHAAGAGQRDERGPVRGHRGRLRHRVDRPTRAEDRHPRHDQRRARRPVSSSRAGRSPPGPSRGPAPRDVRRQHLPGQRDST